MNIMSESEVYKIISKEEKKFIKKLDRLIVNYTFDRNNNIKQLNKIIDKLNNTAVGEHEKIQVPEDVEKTMEMITSKIEDSDAKILEEIDTLTDGLDQMYATFENFFYNDTNLTHHKEKMFEKITKLLKDFKI